MRKLLQFGNRKLPKTTAIFNLPEVVTCIGSTEWCRKNCYAKKASRMYKAVKAYREAMFIESQKPEFITNICLDLYKFLLVKHPEGSVRIHESGDFYNQEYLDKWIEIASRYNNNVFYAYTKAFNLDFSKRPSNFIVRGSIDPSSPPECVEKAKQLDGLAICVDQKEGIIDNTFNCPGSCKTCSYCLKPGDVLFHRH